MTKGAGIVQQIRDLNQRIETSGRAREFIHALRWLMIGRSVSNALSIARSTRAPQRVMDIIEKATSDPLALGGTAVALSPFQTGAQAWFASLANASAFDTLLPFMIQAPFRTRAVAVTSTITGMSLAEQDIKPIGRLSLSASDLEVSKAAAQVVVTEELLRTEGAATFLEVQLRIAVIAATDAKFLSLITAGATSIPASGSTAAAAIADIASLLQAVGSGSGSQLYLVTTASIAKRLATLSASGGARTFPDATVTGGSLAGVPIVVSDGAGAGQIVLADATGIAAAQEGARVDFTAQGAVQMDSAPDSPPTAATNMIGLWQNDMRAIKVERFFGAKAVRPLSVAQITGANYDAGSP
jgi:hypothetical protein